MCRKFKLIAFIFLFFSSTAIAQTKDLQFYKHRADVAGEYFGAVLTAIKYTNSECPIVVHSDWLNKSLVRQQILSYFPSIYKDELREALNQAEREFNREWPTVERLINKRKSEGASCNLITEKGFWLPFDKAVKNWQQEIKR